MKVYLFTVEALDELNNPVTLRFASGEYNADGLDWEIRLKQPALFTTNAFSGGVLQSNSRSGFGEAEILNPDGFLNYLADYAVDGRLAQLWLYDELTNTLELLLSGTVSSISFTTKAISFRLRDPQEELQLPHPQDIYLGNNVLPDGLEGVEGDIKGSNKPKVFGKVRNAEPYLVNTSKLIYQVSSNDCTVDAVYDRGVSLTKGTDYTSLSDLQNNAPSAGTFRSFEGYFRLGSSAVGTVTCDATNNVVLAGDVFAEIALEAGYTVDANDIPTINSYGEVGIYLKNSKSTSQLLDSLASSVGAFWSFDLNQNILLRPLLEPLTEDLEINAFEILSISRKATGAGKNGLPVSEVTVRADRIETVQNDLAGAVAEERRARMANEYREAVAFSQATKDRHPLSDEISIDSDLVSLTDAQDVADRLLNLLSVRRDLVTLQVRLDDITNVNIDTNIKVITKRFGYNNGRIMKVTGLTVDARKNILTLELFG